MSGFDLIIFDCDGVVVDSEILSCGCLLTLLRQHGIEIDLAEVYERFLGRNYQTIVDQYQVWRNEPVPGDFRSKWEAAIRLAFSASLAAMPGVIDLLKGLRAQKTPVCIASSSDLDRVTFSLSLGKLSEFFGPHVFTSQMVKRGKPAPDLFLHAAASMGVTPERALVIEDSVAGVVAAKAAGMTAWGFIGGAHYAGREGRTALEASGAAQVFDKMIDLKRLLVS
jgi:HAD superfamily hydrolase (TIGR01509 family)